MLLNLVEIFEETVYHSRAEGQRAFHLRDVVLNKNHIVFMREDNSLSSFSNDGRLPSNLQRDQKFTRISIARGNVGQDLLVVGSLNSITTMLNDDKKPAPRKKVLKG